MASNAATRTAAGAARVVKPLFSRDLDEAKRRVRELYRAWYREVPNTGRLPRHTGNSPDQHTEHRCQGRVWTVGYGLTFVELTCLEAYIKC